MLAVIVVPMLAPKTIAAAISKLIQPFASKTIVRAREALEACTITVINAPTRVNMITEKKP